MTLGVAGDDGDAAIGGALSSTRGSKTSLLAARVAEPTRRSTSWNDVFLPALLTFVVVSIIGFAILVVLLDSLFDLHGADGSTVFTILVFSGAAGVAASGRVMNHIQRPTERWNRFEYPTLHACWKRSFLCMRCGGVTDPEAVAGAKPSS